MCQVWCSSIEGIYARLKGVSICHGYICIVLYMKLPWCNGFAEICARSAIRCAKCDVAVLKASMLNWRGCQSAMGICALCHIWNLFGVMVFQRSMLNWRGSICHRYMCIVLYISTSIYIYIDLPWDVPSLVQWYSRHLCLFEGGNLPWVYMHCAIYETYLV